MTATPALADHFRGGAGNPLLLVHGFAATWRTWGPLPRVLSGDFDVLAPTLPGHTGGPELDGRPTITVLAGGVERMMDDVGWATAHVAGFSLGGWLGLELAKRGRVRTLTVIAPGGAHALSGTREARRVGRVFRAGRRGARLVLPNIERIARSARLRRVALRNMMVAAQRMTADEFVEMLTSHAATPAFDTLLEEMGADGGLQGLDRVTVPVHILWGEKDRVLRIRHAQFFRDALPHATFEVLRKAGHVPFWDARDEIANAIRSHARAAVRQ